MTGRHRGTVFAALACGAATVAAVPALTAREAGGDPPTVHGPLMFTDQRCFQKGGRDSCAFDYRLDPAATDDPGDEWHAYWASSQSAERARHGFCTTEVVEELTWQGTARAARTAPAAGAGKVVPGAATQLAVDAAGHTHVAAGLEQLPTWPAGLVTSTAAAGRLTVLWQGATTRPMTLAFGAEVLNPTGPATNSGGDQYEVGVPCAHIGPPGPGFLARIRPAVSSRGHPAYLQVRIPGTHLRPGPNVKPGLATVRIGAGRPTVFEVVGHSALALTWNGLFPGPYVARVTLHGPSGTRHYRLRFRAR